MTILEQLAEHARFRTEETKKVLPFAAIRSMAEQLPKKRGRFASALSREGISFICECKKASPSKGLIAADFPYLHIAKDYEAAGADAISVLTEPKWFLGSDEYLRKIAAQVSIPCLRKDFTVDPYMIYEAKLLGASAVLLICALLDKSRLSEYHKIAESVGLSVLTEAHDEREAETAAEIGAQIIGVNNRDLRDFTVDLSRVHQLRRYVPADTLFVAESGMKTADEIRAVRDAGADAVLIGETLMRAPDKAAALRMLKGLEP